MRGYGLPSEPTGGQCCRGGVYGGLRGYLVGQQGVAAVGGGLWWGEGRGARGYLVSQQGVGVVGGVCGGVRGEGLPGEPTTRGHSCRGGSVVG